jgi:acetolactate synthase-1/2/3 large subunit
LTRPRADRDEVARAAELIVAAARPVIVAGGGVLASGAWDVLTELAESCGLPVATSINGKGAIAETSPVSVGVVGGNGARTYANAWIAEADLVFFIGTRTESTATNHWTLPSRERPPVTIHLDVAEREIGNAYPNGAVLIGDARATLEDLRDALHSDAGRLKARSRDRIARLDAQRTQYFDQVDAAARSDDWPMKPQRVVREMREILDDEVVIVADPGTPTP